MVERLHREVRRVHARRCRLARAQAPDVEVIDRPFLSRPRDDRRAVGRHRQRGAGEMDLVALGRVLPLDPRTERDAARRGRLAAASRRHDQSDDRVTKDGEANWSSTHHFHLHATEP